MYKMNINYAYKNKVNNRFNFSFLFFFFFFFFRPFPNTCPRKSYFPNYPKYSNTTIPYHTYHPKFEKVHLTSPADPGYTLPLQIV